MAKQVQNSFVEIDVSNEADLLSQHQKLFQGNVIAQWDIQGTRYFKVPYGLEETPAPGLSRDAFMVLLLTDLTRLRLLIA